MGLLDACKRVAVVGAKVGVSVHPRQQPCAVFSSLSVITLGPKRRQRHFTFTQGFWR